jgi:hypothetical protein
MFVPCDRGVHVSGHVLDAQHRPISHATVEFYGVKKETADDGCFRFGGHLAASGFAIKVSKPTYKTYSESKEFNYYDIDVTLESENNEQQSSATWHTLSKDQLPKYEKCED